ncbi:class I SAM-dependent methyltransferase [Bacillus cereus group sp. BfR-BA-01441]|uniref:class I SAM-dependent methyltransferase n=1 Tax=Bacillus cereus group sp. BfR-BA-01441 TaxID=2920348 RepID=UPI001F57DC99
MKTTENFTDRANIYAKYRPSYPNEYIDYLLSANQLKGNRIVADIGSGTGIFSHQLLESGLHVIGVEPNDDMRKMAEQSLKLYSRFQSIKANVALVWNSRDLTSPLIKENAEICQKTCPNFKGFSGGIDETPEVFNNFFKDGKYDFKEYQNDLLFDYEEFLGRNLSASYAPKENDEQYKNFIFLLSELFEKYSKDGKIILPNLTRSYLGNV